MSVKRVSKNYGVFKGDTMCLLYIEKKDPDGRPYWDRVCGELPTDIRSFFRELHQEAEGEEEED
jgi:hypothetical protein